MEVEIKESSIRFSEDFATFAKAFIAAQAEFKEAELDSKNPFYKSQYASMASIVKACREPLAKHGLGFFQIPFNTGTEFGKVGVRTRIFHESGAWMECDFILPVKEDTVEKSGTKGQADFQRLKAITPQTIVGAVTFGCRIMLQKVLGIASEGDDDDGNDASGKTLGSGEFVGVITEVREEKKKSERTGKDYTRFVVVVKDAGECYTMERGLAEHAKKFIGNESTIVTKEHPQYKSIDLVDVFPVAPPSAATMDPAPAAKRPEPTQEPPPVEYVFIKGAVVEKKIQTVGEVTNYGIKLDNNKWVLPTSREVFDALAKLEGTGFIIEIKATTSLVGGQTKYHAVGYREIPPGES